MANSARCIATTAVLAIVQLTLPLTAPKETWIRVRTQHLLIVSSAGESATTEVAQRLERFVDAFSSIAGIGASPDVPVTLGLQPGTPGGVPYGGTSIQSR